MGIGETPAGGLEKMAAPPTSGNNLFWGAAACSQPRPSRQAHRSHSVMFDHEKQRDAIANVA
jgi:hypothetical protein